MAGVSEIRRFADHGTVNARPSEIKTNHEFMSLNFVILYNIKSRNLTSYLNWDEGYFLIKGNYKRQYRKKIKI